MNTLEVFGAVFVSLLLTAFIYFAVYGVVSIVQEGWK